jgi:hypothetical protein
MCASCTSQSAKNDRTVTRSDSSGVEIVTTATPVWESKPNSALTIRDTPDVEIGSTPDALFFNVIGVHLLSNGQIAVADAGLSQIRMYDSGGEFVRAVGGRGEGPGEFKRMHGFFLCPTDTLVVDESARLSVFAGNGDFIRVEPVVPRLQDRNLGLSGMDENCTAVLAKIIYPDAPSQITLYFANRETAARNTLVTLTAIPIVERPTYPTALPYGPWASWAAAKSGAYVALGGAPEIKLYERGQRLRRIIRWQTPPTALTDEDRDRFSQFRQKSLAESPGRNDLPAPDEFTFPDTKPAIAGLLVDDLGNIWVRSYPSDAPGFLNQIQNGPDRPREKWSVIDSTGAFLGDLTMPQGLQVMGIQANHVIGVFRDTLDVQHVRLHAISTTPRQ